MALLGLFAAFVLSKAFHGDFIREQPIGAFGAFYCGGITVRTGGNPYRTEPLRSCERALPGYQNYRIDGVVEPVPLPGYALAPFAALSLLPFKTAFVLFSVLGILATIIAVIVLAHLTALPAVVIGAALLLSDLFRNITFGELPPIVIGALSLAAFFVTRERFGAATIMLGVAFIEPHVTLPAILALGITTPRARPPLIALGAMLLFLSLVTTGLHGSSEYFMHVLNAQAAAELPARDQCSLSWILNAFGVKDRIALMMGSLSYVFSAALGIILAASLAHRYNKPAYVVLLPPAIAMIGGIFLHDIQISIALPAALLLLGRLPTSRTWSLAAVLALVTPWPAYGRLTVLATPVVVAIITAGCGLFVDIRARVAAAFFASATIMLLFSGLQRLDGHPLHPVAAPPTSIAQTGDDTANASNVWARYVRVSGYGTSSQQSIAEKIPLWGVLLVLGIICTQATANAERSGPVETAATGARNASSSAAT
jgi:Glycosyltransferase family 87